MRLTVPSTATTSIATRPPVLTVFIEAWGGGGAGGAATGNPAAGGGGSGGQYANKLDTVTGSTSYSLNVASGVLGSTSQVRNGNDTTWRTDVCVAKGGVGAAPTTGVGTGALGSTDGGVGDVVIAGGNGADAASTGTSGAGGGGGGGNASGTTAGVATPPGGDGGAGLSGSGTTGLAGTGYGGGGGGARATNVTDRAGGTGAIGGMYVWELDQRDLLLMGCG